MLLIGRPNQPINRQKTQHIQIDDNNPVKRRQLPTLMTRNGARHILTMERPSDTSPAETLTDFSGSLTGAHN
jgi:hypothetical protein